jgi:hypothetical protein
MLISDQGKKGRNLNNATEEAFQEGEIVVSNGGSNPTPISGISC